MEQVQRYQAKTYQMMPSKRTYLYRAGFKGQNLRLDTTMTEAVNQIYAEGLKLAQPELHYRTFARDQLPTELIPKLYAQSQQITFWVSTLGVQIDHQIQQYIKQDKVFLATLLDAWASEALEELNDSFHTHLKDQYGVGERRFSPGFGTLELSVNQVILRLLHPTKVTAHPQTGILSPSKSTTCLIGW